MEAVCSFLRGYVSEGIAMIPQRAFIAHLRWVEGHGMEEAEQAWAQAFATCHKREIDDNGQVTLPMNLPKTYIRARGMSRENQWMRITDLKNE